MGAADALNNTVSWNIGCMIMYDMLFEFIWFKNETMNTQIIFPFICYIRMRVRVDPILNAPYCIIMQWIDQSSSGGLNLWMKSQHTHRITCFITDNICFCILDRRHDISIPSLDNTCTLTEKHVHVVSCINLIIDLFIASQFIWVCESSQTSKLGPSVLTLQRTTSSSLSLH